MATVLVRTWASVGEVDIEVLLSASCMLHASLTDRQGLEKRKDCRICVSIRFQWGVGVSSRWLASVESSCTVGALWISMWRAACLLDLQRASGSSCRV